MNSGGGHRYGEVLAVTVAMATFALAAPEGRATRAIEVLAAGAALLAAMLTSGARPAVQRRTAILLGVALAVAALGVGLSAPPGVLVFTITALAVAATIVVIVAGLGRLIIERGVTLQVVFGSLAIYLLIGLTFGFVVGAIATAGDGAYFAQGTDGTQSQRIYFSYTALSTTGFGDLTARTAPGRALSVLEMLIGQLYLVTVISVIITPARGGCSRPVRSG